MAQVKVADATINQLNWLVAKTLGYALRKPNKATWEDIEDKTLPFTLHAVCLNVDKTGATISKYVDTFEVTGYKERMLKGITRTWLTGSDFVITIDDCYADKAEAELEIAIFEEGDALEFKAGWAHMGPIIEQGCIALLSVGFSSSKTAWAAKISRHQQSNRDEYGNLMYSLQQEDLHYGLTPLEAVMRCYVASEFGTVTEVPEELT